MWSTNFHCTIDESIKGATSLRRYGITFDGNIDIKYKIPCFFTLPCEIIMQEVWSHNHLQSVYRVIVVRKKHVNREITCHQP